MAYVMPEIIVRRLIDLGIKELRADKPAFNELFTQFADPDFNPDFGSDYRDQIWTWFTTTKIPVVQAWSFNAQKIPCISIHLANETEDESKAAMNDLAAIGHNADVGTAVFTVMVDVGIHVARGGDHVIWLYYIVNYILFKYKLLAHKWGLKLQTFSASDYSKDADKAMNNIWTRWVRFRCTTQNFWVADPYRKFEHVNTDPTIGGPESCEIATSLDVNPCDVDRTANKGIVQEPVGVDAPYDPYIDDPIDDDVI